MGSETLAAQGITAERPVVATRLLAFIRQRHRPDPWFERYLTEDAGMPISHLCGRETGGHAFADRKMTIRQ